MSVTSINYAGNGNFQMTVNGKTQTFNLADLNTMLRMEQVATYDQQIADQLGEIQATNQKRKALNQLLAKMRQFKSENKDDNAKAHGQYKVRPEKGDAGWKGDYDGHYDYQKKQGKSDAEAKRLAEQESDRITAKAQGVYDAHVAKDSFSLDGYGGPKDVATWMKEFGITRTDVNPGDKDKAGAAWDANINAAKSAIDNITSDSEMQMLRFRQMVDKRGTALQEAKTTLTNDKRLKDAIVQG